MNNSKKVCDELYISPGYLANIENKGQQSSLQVFYDFVTRHHISVDQFFFPNSNAENPPHGGSLTRC
jgi:hypothetical protein